MTIAPALRTEEAIIQGFLAPLAAGAPGALGLNDDCAVAAPSPGCEFVLKTDAVAAGVHFLPDDPPADIGWKALAVNVSDLAAKGARPVGYLMSLAFPEAPTSDWMAAFASGLREAQGAFGIDLLGGDTDRRPGPLSITPTVLGEVPVGRMILRAAARPGDVVCVTGSLGDAGLGLALRRDADCRTRWQLSPEDAAHILRRFLRPQPRLEMRAALRAHAGASMDISDGLMKDLGRMCRASGVGAQIEHAALPLSAAFKAVRLADPIAAEASLFAGDDYEILCAVPPDRFASFQATAAAAGVAVTRVGSFTRQPDVDLREVGGRSIVVGRSGWDHF